MITIFTTPKPHEEQVAIWQNNAVRSWQELDAEIIIFNADYRYSSCAKYISSVPTGPNNLPYISHMFGLAEEIASNDLLVYANADLILLPDLIPTMWRIAQCFKQFLAIGQKWDIELNEPIDFNNPDWEDELRNHVQGNGTLHSVSGKDWMGWRRPLGLDIQPYVAGRAMWDNDVVDMALKANIPVVDATRCVTAIHPDHGYPDDWLWDEPAEHNRALCDVPPNMGRISEATWEMMMRGEIIER